MNFMTSDITKSSIYVLGMHRSGTSVVAGLLSLLGLGLPKTLLPADAENPKGYFESPVFMDLNDRLLAAVDSSWSDWRMIQPLALADLQSSEAAGQIRAAVTAEFGDDRMVVIKDPRICRLLPIWRSALSDLNFSSGAIIPYRSPAEVARSLNVRDGMAFAKGLMAWLRHALDAELATRDMPRSFVLMPELIGDPERVLARIGKDIGIEWPISINETKKKIDDFVDAKLHRQKVSKSALEAAGSVSHWVQSAFEAFEELKRKPNNPASQKTLDDIRIAFDESQRLFGPIIEETRFATESRKKVDAELEATKRENERLEVLLKSIGSDIEGLVVDLDNRNDEISILRAQTEDLARQTAEIEKSRAESETRLLLEAELARTQRDMLESNFALYGEQSLGLAKSAAALLDDLPALSGREAMPDFGNRGLSELSAFECYDLATRSIAAAGSVIRESAAERSALEAALHTEREASESRKQVDAELEATKRENGRLEALLKSSGSELEGMVVDLGYKEDEISILRAQSEALQRQVAEIEKSKAESESRLGLKAELAQTQNAALMAQNETIEKLAANLTGKVKELESELNFAQILLNEAQIRIDALATSREALQQDRDDGVSLIADLKRNIDDLDQKQRLSEQKIEQAEEKIADQVARQRELEAEKQATAVLVTELKQQRKSLTERNRASERKVERIRMALEAKMAVLEGRHAAYALERQTLFDRIESGQRDAIEAERRSLEAVTIIETRFAALIDERERELGQRLDHELQKMAAEREQAEADHVQRLNGLQDARQEMERNTQRVEDEYYKTRMQLMLSDQDLSRYRRSFMRRLIVGLVGKTRNVKRT